MGYTIPQFGSLNIVDATPENGWATEATFDSSKNSLISLQTNAGNIFNLGCELKDTYTGNDYENTGTVANPVWSLVQNTAGAPVAPASSLQ